MENIDWPCKTYTLFRKTNLGCKEAVSNAITWFFNNESEGIILEDDCLPSKFFFEFCSNQLSFHRYNDQVMSISGNNFLPKNKESESYYLSRIPHIWGWATWKRAWEKYDIGLNELNSLEKKWKTNPFYSILEKYYWLMMFYRVKNNDFSTWDFQWTYSIMNSNGYSITPRENLVRNIGFESTSTHTNSDEMNLGVIEMSNGFDIDNDVIIHYNEHSDYLTLKRTLNLRQKIKTYLYFLLNKYPVTSFLKKRL